MQSQFDKKMIENSRRLVEQSRKLIADLNKQGDSLRKNQDAGSKRVRDENWPLPQDDAGPAER